MKVLVHFEPARLDYFEGARMRKTIKGALELNEIRHTSEFLDTFDLAHLISPEDTLKTNYLINNSVKTVISCFYTESDENARFLDYKFKKDVVEKVTLKPKALRLLNNCSLVTIPSLEYKKELVDLGVTNKIEVLDLGINLARFDFSREDEKEIFYRYFGESNNRKLVLAMGGVNPRGEEIDTFNQMAKTNPDTTFYYLGAYETSKLKKIIKKQIKAAPENAKFVGILTDDVHRSALLNASLVIFPGFSKAGLISIYEAMAAKCQIIARDIVVAKDVLSNFNNAYIAPNSDSIISLVNDYLKGVIQPTIDKAYEQVCEKSLVKFGENLLQIYKKIS